MKYKIINGWTKKAMIEAIQTRNTGKICTVTLANLGLATCIYDDGAGNHCAVGCFIPEEVLNAPGARLELNGTGAVPFLVDSFPELAMTFPLSVEGMHELQRAHDGYTGEGDVRKELIKWIKLNTTTRK